MDFIHHIGQWAWSTRSPVAPVLFLATAFVVIADIIFVAGYVPLTEVKTFEIKQAAIVMGMAASLCVALGLLAFCLDEQAIASKRKASGGAIGCFLNVLRLCIRSTPDCT
jgi:hypothetical protein